MERLSKSSKETKNIAGKLAKSLKAQDVVALYGELGAGKTTFVQGLVRALGGNEREVISPTFVILKDYKVKSKVNSVSHIDLYRLEEKYEIDDLGLDELFEDQKGIVIIEWAEKAKGLLPKKRINVYFEYVDENKRKIKIEHHGSPSQIRHRS